MPKSKDSEIIREAKFQARWLKDALKFLPPFDAVSNARRDAFFEKFLALEKAGVDFDAYYHDGKMAKIRVRKKPRLPRSARPQCGARCRDGHLCRAPVVIVTDGSGQPVARSRCKLHGGLSTGPKTAKGRAAIAESNRRRAKVTEKS